MNKIVALAIAAALAAPLTAEAGSFGRACTSAPQSEWLTLEALQAKVTAMGYKVQKGKLKNGCGEIYTIDKDGNRVELFVDPTSGAIVGKS